MNAVTGTSSDANPTADKNIWRPSALAVEAECDSSSSSSEARAREDYAVGEDLLSDAGHSTWPVSSASVVLFLQDPRA